jgi:hypothetical protein
LEQLAEDCKSFGGRVCEHLGADRALHRSLHLDISLFFSSNTSSRI